MNLRARIERLESLLLKFRAALTPGPQSDFTATTTDALTTTVDTGYKPPNGQVAGIDGGLVVKDLANSRGNKANIAGEVDNFAGLVIPQQPIVSGHRGDAALAGATLTYGVSGAGTLTIILTPPGGYVGTIDWHVHQDYDQI